MSLKSQNGQNVYNRAGDIALRCKCLPGKSLVMSLIPSTHKKVHNIAGELWKLGA